MSDWTSSPELEDVIDDVIARIIAWKRADESVVATGLPATGRQAGEPTGSVVGSPVVTRTDHGRVAAVELVQVGQTGTLSTVAANSTAAGP